MSKKKKRYKKKGSKEINKKELLQLLAAFIQLLVAITMLIKVLTEK